MDQCACIVINGQLKKEGKNQSLIRKLIDKFKRDPSEKLTEESKDELQKSIDFLKNQLKKGFPREIKIISGKTEGQNYTAKYLAKELGVEKTETEQFLVNPETILKELDKSKNKGNLILVTDVSTLHGIMKKEYQAWHREHLLTKERLSFLPGQSCIREFHKYGPTVISYTFPFEKIEDVLLTSWL